MLMPARYFSIAHAYEFIFKINLQFVLILYAHLSAKVFRFSFQNLLFQLRLEKLPFAKFLQHTNDKRMFEVIFCFEFGPKRKRLRLRL